MLAVVREDPIVAFAEARACPLNHCATIEGSLVVPYPDRMALSEALKGNVLHWSTPQSVCKAGVVNDTPVADVNAVVRVERARRDEMGRKWGLFPGRQKRVCLRDHDGRR
jgi:hypothetical protein